MLNCGPGNQSGSVDLEIQAMVRLANSPGRSQAHKEFLGVR